MLSFPVKVHVDDSFVFYRNINVELPKSLKRYKMTTSGEISLQMTRSEMVNPTIYSEEEQIIIIGMEGGKYVKFVVTKNPKEVLGELQNNYPMTLEILARAYGDAAKLRQFIEKYGYTLRAGWYNFTDKNLVDELKEFFSYFCQCEDFESSESDKNLSVAASSVDPSLEIRLLSDSEENDSPLDFDDLLKSDKSSPSKKQFSINLDSDFKSNLEQEHICNTNLIPNSIDVIVHCKSGKLKIRNMSPGSTLLDLYEIVSLYTYRKVFLVENGKIKYPERRPLDKTTYEFTIVFIKTRSVDTRRLFRDISVVDSRVVVVETPEYYSPDASDYYMTVGLVAYMAKEIDRGSFESWLYYKGIRAWSDDILRELRKIALGCGQKKIADDIYK